MSEQGSGKGPDSEDRDFISQWMPKIGGTATVFFTMILLAAHPRPGSIDSLIFGVSWGIPSALVVTVLVFLVLLMIRKRRK